MLIILNIMIYIASYGICLWVSIYGFNNIILKHQNIAKILQ